MTLVSVCIFFLDKCFEAEIDAEYAILLRFREVGRLFRRGFEHYWLKRDCCGCAAAFRDVNHLLAGIFTKAQTVEFCLVLVMRSLFSQTHSRPGERPVWYFHMLGLCTSYDDDQDGFGGDGK